MTEPVFSYGKWIIGFHNGGDTQRWWRLFTRPGFRHCFAFRYLQPMDAWAIVEWSNVGMFVEFVPKRFIDGMIYGVNDRGGCFLEVEAVPRGMRVLPQPFLYCVSAVKDLVGLRDWRVITPWQLYCALRKQGAQPMFDLDLIKENSDAQRTWQRKDAGE